MFGDYKSNIQSYIQRKVERTKDRPLASGKLSMKQATALLASQLLLSLGILLQFNWYAVGMGFAVMPIVLLYPAVKRISHWPQAVLGLAFNWGAILGWAAIHGSVDWKVIAPLYIAGVLWTLHYDTIYAHQDKSDDTKVGIKSTALRLGDNTKTWLMIFSAGTIGGIGLSGYMMSLSMAFYPVLGIAALNLANQIRTLDINNPQDCGKKFRENKIFGGLVFLALLLGKVFEITVNIN
eukprot:TRINITY_DN7436_c0_g1_i1.p1 TRINITY_DN7436_c0_g1~~TRINITY_DN7436_c0_g1_i1.p1  ORF type:complete len:237 (+),score=28.71 TRINITY_DN7436_c0_g1_i1:355-1065(+)